MKYYAYYRVSTESQVEKNGIQMQKDVVEKYCSEHGIEISGVFTDEGISGTEETREGLYDLIAELEKGDKVIVQNTSRLWRDDMVRVFVHKELKSIGADIVSIENEKYTIYEKDPSNFLFNAIMEAFDVYDRMQISMKLAKGKRAKAQTGNKPCGNAPIGYKWEGRFVVPSDDAHIVKEIFEQYLETHNMSKVKRYCDEKGYKTARGGSFAVSSIKAILTNDFYIGVITYNDKIEGQHKAIIDREVFEKVQRMM